MSGTDDAWTRRSFLGLAGLATGASLGVGGGPLLAAERARGRAMRRVVAGRTRSPQADDDWRDVLEAFDLGGRATMNTANLAPASAPARAALEAWTDAVDSDPSFQSRARFDETRRLTRERAAAWLGVDPPEIVLTRNTSEGNSIVVQGLELGPGDEVLLTEHNHPSNREGWHVRARRHGFAVVEVPVPTPPPSPEALLDGLREAATPRTRVVAFSHVTNTGGCRYPAAEICAWAREQEILTLVDGAQTCGCLAVDLRSMGCDFYTASAHKWPCSVREVGVLFVRRGSEESLWPSVLSVGYDESDAPGRLEALGQRDDAALAAFGSALEFLDAIGRRQVEARVAALTGYLKEEIGALPGVTLYTPVEAGFSAGVVTFHMDGVDARRAHQWLYDERQVVSAPSGVEQGGVRLSPHVYTSMVDCERAVEAVREVVRGIAGI